MAPQSLREHCCYIVVVLETGVGMPDRAAKEDYAILVYVQLVSSSAAAFGMPLIAQSCAMKKACCTSPQRLYQLRDAYKFSVKRGMLSENRGGGGDPSMVLICMRSLPLLRNEKVVFQNHGMETIMWVSRADRGRAAFSIQPRGFT